MDKEELAKKLVHDYLSNKVPLANIKIVWFCKVINNWKAIVADISEGGRLFEVTYSGENKDVNIDVYEKVDSERIKD